MLHDLFCLSGQCLQGQYKLDFFSGLLDVQEFFSRNFPLH